jgi:hypothetical protein
MTRAEILPAGSQYGKLTVVRFVGVDEKGHGVHEFLCVCGRTRKCRTYLTKRGSPSCGNPDCRNHATADLAGKRFGRLLVVHKTRSESGALVWRCLCDCGGTRDVRNGRLRSGHIKSCGCMAHDSIFEALAAAKVNNAVNYENALRLLVNSRFGQVTIVDVDCGTDRKGGRLVKCRCDCGGEVVCSLSSLRAGDRIRCRLPGCCRIEHMLSGRRFGKLVVLGESKRKLSGGKQKLWVCKCQCGRLTEATTHALNKKRRSCGKGACRWNWRGGKRNIGSEAWARMRLARIGISSRRSGCAEPYESWERVIELWNECNNACSCCKRKRKGTLVLDHCHQTGRLRGFVCSGCNTAIGLIGESSSALAAASRYVATQCNQQRMVFA